MKIKIPLPETFSAATLIGFLFLINDKKLLMPKSLEMTTLLLFVVSFLAFSAAIWKERPKDERENLHRLNAGRLSFLAGSVVLVVGILVQALGHDVDPWLIYVLVAMVGSKLASRIVSQWRN